MAKNTGMNAQDDKAGKTGGLSPAKAKEVNKKLKDEKNDLPPTKTVAAVDKERDRRKNERSPEDKIFKSH